MVLILGIESTAHTFGVGIVKNGKILSNVKSMYSTESGGIIPMDSAKHHREIASEIYKTALEDANVDEKNIDAIAFSQGPGLSPCLLEGLKFAKQKSKELNVPLVPVNHCVAHLEIGKLTGAKDPVLLYCSGANTQIIAYAAEKYRIFGETLDIGVGNFIDNFARYAGIGFPGGPKIEQMARESKNYVEIPYTIKGMDVAFSGMLTNLKQKLEKIKQFNKKRFFPPTPPKFAEFRSDVMASRLFSTKFFAEKISNPAKNFRSYDNNSKINNLSEKEDKLNYNLNDLCYSLQETAFAMLIETAERALAHVGKNELLFGGGVACNLRLQEMCKIMCEERGAKFFCPEKSLLVDNGAMIAYLGEIMFKSGIKFSGKNADELDIKPRERTDDVSVGWR